MNTFIFCWLDRLIAEALHLLAGHHWHLRCDVVSSNVLSKACAQAPGFRGFNKPWIPSEKIINKE